MCVFQKENVTCPDVDFFKIKNKNKNCLILGKQAIREKILSMDFSVEEIKGVDCQDSLNGGVMAFVTGLLTREEDNSKREFIQSFFLAPHETGFYVLNDMLLYAAEGHPDSSLNDSRSSPQPENGIFFCPSIKFQVYIRQALDHLVGLCG